MYRTLSTITGGEQKKKVEGSCDFRLMYDMYSMLCGTEEDFRYELFECFGRERPIFWETIKKRSGVSDLLSITCKSTLEVKYDDNQVLGLDAYSTFLLYEFLRSCRTRIKQPKHRKIVMNGENPFLLP